MLKAELMQESEVQMIKHLTLCKSSSFCTVSPGCCHVSFLLVSVQRLWERPFISDTNEAQAAEPTSLISPLQQLAAFLSLFVSRSELASHSLGFKLKNRLFYVLLQCERGQRHCIFVKY